MLLKLLFLTLLTTSTISRPPQQNDTSNANLDKLCDQEEAGKMERLLDRIFSCEEKLLPEVNVFGNECYEEIYGGLEEDTADKVRVKLCGQRDKYREFDRCVDYKLAQNGKKVYSDDEYWKVIEPCVVR